MLARIPKLLSTLLLVALVVAGLPSAAVAQDVAPKATYSLSGNVSGAGAGVLSGVVVRASTTAGIVVSTTTNSLGNYKLTLDSDEYVIRFEGNASFAPGWYGTAGYVVAKSAAKRINVAAAVTGISVTLPPLRHITGTVTAQAGGALDGLTVSTTDADGRVISATTAGGGLYDLPVPAGTFKVLVRDEAGAYASGWYTTGGWKDDGSLATGLAVSTSNRTGIDMAVPAGVTISGNVTGGWPISVRVCVINADGHEIGGCPITDGLWSVTVVPGAYTLRAVDLGRAYIGGWWTADGSVATMAGATVIDVVDTPLSGYQFVMVLDTVGAVVSSASVSFRVGAVLTMGMAPITIRWTAYDAGVGLQDTVYEQSTDGGSTYTAINWVEGFSDQAWAPLSGTLKYRLAAEDWNGNYGAYRVLPARAYRLNQQTAGSFTYRGTWSTVYSSSYSGGSERYATTAGASATFTITGHSAAFVTTRGPGRGKANIYVDGVLATTVDLYRATLQQRYVAWQTSWTTLATHTVRVVVVGTAGRPRVDLDGFLSTN